MLDDSELEGLTLKQIRHLRDNLLRPILGEPVIDPGFERPPEKLRALAEETVQNISSLMKTLVHFEKRSQKMEQIVTVLDSGRSVLQKLHVDPQELPDPEETIREAPLQSTLPKEVSEKLDEARHLKNAILVERERLSTEGLQLSAEAHTLSLVILTCQRQVALLALFLQKIAERITKGTNEAFHFEDIQPNMVEFTVDGFDKALDTAHLPALGPIIHLVKFILASLHQKENYNTKLESTWTAFEQSVFLSAYFKWWSDDNGKSEIATQITACEAAYSVCDGAVETFTNTVLALGQNLQSLTAHQANHEALRIQLRQMISALP